MWLKFSFWGQSPFKPFIKRDRIQTYIEEQSYYVGDHTRLNIEEEKVHTQIVKTLEGGRFVREALRGGRCEGAVLMEIVKVGAHHYTNYTFRLCIKILFHNDNLTLNIYNALWMLFFIYIYIYVDTDHYDLRRNISEKLVPLDRCTIHRLGCAPSFDASPDS